MNPFRERERLEDLLRENLVARAKELRRLLESTGDHCERCLGLEYITKSLVLSHSQKFGLAGMV
jgi:hypothetical protein